YRGISCLPPFNRTWRWKEPRDRRHSAPADVGDFRAERGEGGEQLQLAARVDGTRTKNLEARERHLILPTGGERSCANPPTASELFPEGIASGETGAGPEPPLSVCRPLLPTILAPLQRRIQRVEEQGPGIRAQPRSGCACPARRAPRHRRHTLQSNRIHPIDPKQAERTQP